MNALQLKPRQPAADEVENWDDDDFLIDNENLTFRSTSTSVQGPWHRRGSHSSHVSLRSELESVPGEERQVHLPGDDEKSILDAIAAAAKAGIPLPQNVPPSALVGGTIKRLGGRRLKKMIQEDDWGEDLELPDMGQPLRVKQQDSSTFPDALRQVGSSAQASPVKSVKGSDNGDQQPPTVATSSVDLERFRDTQDDDDFFFGDGAATMKVPKNRQPAKPVSLITPPTPQKKVGDEDFENDFELPSDGTLTLSNRKDIPRTPAMNNTLDDFDWGEGSLGTRHGGTRRDGRSNRSSSASALSPSIASSMTAESEDETFDGLVLPIGPVDFEERLQRRRKSRSPERQEAPKPAAAPQPEAADKEDFATGLDLGDGDVFSSGKLTLHRNVKIKETRPASPARPKTAVSLTFTNKPATTAAASRLPRPVVGHERSHTQTSLEPVSESGGPILLPRPRRPHSRLSGHHSAQSSISSVQTPTATTPSSSQSFAPATPRRREAGQKPSAVSLRPEPTTTSAQLLRLKRSLPAMRPSQSPAARPCAGRTPDRPPSRTDTGSRPNSYIRPRTPTDRIRPGAESAQGRRHPVPFLPAGASVSQSHNINARGSRTFRRHDSDNSMDGRPSSRAASRSTMRSPSPSKRSRNTAEKLAQEGAASQYISRPRRQRNFGDGHELDGFDDLPTSTHTEAKYMRQPITTGPKAQLRNKIYQNILPTDRTNTPSPHSMLTPSRPDHLPHFARDTAASRIARETSLAQRVPSSGPLAPLTTQRVAQLSTRANLNHPHLPHPTTVRSRRTSKKSQQLQPHLIANLNTCKESKTVNGMLYNPETFRWEGNENVLNAFDVPAASASTAPAAQFFREKENATPRPALITPIGATTKGPQIVGSMVFDPQNMCWVKLGPRTNNRSDASDPMDGFNAFGHDDDNNNNDDDDDDDVFKDIPDLEDNTMDSSEVGRHGRVSDIKDDWLVGEEFDVGPEFVRRQREEEERWRKKLDKWRQPGIQRDREAERWTIRDILLGDS